MSFSSGSQYTLDVSTTKMRQRSINSKKKKKKNNSFFVITFTDLPCNYYSSQHPTSMWQKLALSAWLNPYHISSFPVNTFLLSLLLAVQTTHTTNYSDALFAWTTSFERLFQQQSLFPRVQFEQNVVSKRAHVGFS